MRIVFAGTQSVGKTTLIEDLQAACPEYRIEEEPIRAVARRTGQPPPSIPTRAAERALVDHGRSRLLATAPGDRVLFDRSPLDAHAHSILSMEIGGEIDPAFLAEIEPRVIEALGHADLVVFVPIERDVGNQPDGFRYLDASNRRRVHSILEDLLLPDRGITRAPVVRVRGDRATRVRQVRRAMTAHAATPTGDGGETRVGSSKPA
ncbi:MAG: AAA family ATPase [Planctomycetia bacterium]|jgi:nicotinamide riboside kinase|nr:AAA family ATPase [Planctomycetia bacterium]